MSADRADALKAVDDAFSDGVKHLYAVFVQGLVTGAPAPAELVRISVTRVRQDHSRHHRLFCRIETMIKTIITAALLALSSVASAQQQMKLEDCAPQWRREIGGRLFCLLGEQIFTDRKLGEPIIVDGRYGAPIAKPVCDTEHNTVCRGGASPYSGHGH